MSKKVDHKKLTADACERLALSGDPEAQCEMARRYLYGERGVKQNGTRAKEFYRSAAANGNAEAMFYMGMTCLRGEYSEFDEQKGVEWFEKAIVGDSGLCAAVAEVYFRIGSDLYDGDYTFEDWYGDNCELHTLEIDKAKGLMYMDRAIELGYIDGAYQLGYIYYFDIGDHKRALELFEKSDFIRSWALIGSMYACGDGTPVDFLRAIEYFKKCVRYDCDYSFNENAVIASNADDGRTAGYCYYCVGKAIGNDIMAYECCDAEKAEKYYALAKQHGYDPALAPSGGADYYD